MRVLSTNMALLGELLIARRAMSWDVSHMSESERRDDGGWSDA
jgi:hypothetical protein